MRGKFQLIGVCDLHFFESWNGREVRFGSKADMCSAKADVRFTPNSDRESGLPQTVMSALPPKADICGALADVRYGPIADSRAAANSILFDYCVDARKDLRGHVEAKRFRRF